MTKIFLATHGRMASGMKSSIDLLMGSSEALTVFDAYLPGVTVSVGEQAKLLVSDMLGGSVNQELMKYSDLENVFVITGITLTLLLELLCQCHQNFTASQLDELIENSRLMTQRVSLDVNSSQDQFF